MNSKNRTESVCWNTLVPHIRIGRMSVDFFIENIVNKNVIESDYALKIMFYTISLSTQKERKLLIQALVVYVNVFHIIAL